MSMWLLACFHFPFNLNKTIMLFRCTMVSMYIAWDRLILRSGFTIVVTSIPRTPFFDVPHVMSTACAAARMVSDAGEMVRRGRSNDRLRRAVVREEVKWVRTAGRSTGSLAYALSTGPPRGQVRLSWVSVTDFARRIEGHFERFQVQAAVDRTRRRL